MTARQLAALRELAALAEVGDAPSPAPPTSIRVIPNPRLTRRRFSQALATDLANTSASSSPRPLRAPRLSRR
ncbi:BZ3500_MvSof-1268-A1-R1_Chr7-1g09096 [Microbotryum saponariae]|uniref:BZ3500_MvSof-1268-A1-R1_Chr7-1g09096 protein n=1 Tax=Microbotryum saponariae TaxID=289078 RepID=A0A2X0KW81_9BASI|nr:BZ3501_MvSof-1269-A2-R1_Chr7-1g08801 [Microbotryum saponariae]SDA02793.1 BZ3500_MvSof-1268-A1-R1_Chr7-1g09096 [Microbotryum saponariae]